VVFGAAARRGGGKNPALTISVLREAFSRIITLRHLTLQGIVRELNETLRRKEESRIYHWHTRTGHYPPRCTAVTHAAPGQAPGDPPDP
jgi:hypothetical protein